MSINIAFDALLFSNKKEGIINYIHYLIKELLKKNDTAFSIDIYINEKYVHLIGESTSNVTFVPIKIRNNFHRLLIQYLMAFRIKKNYDVYFSPDYPIPFFLPSKIKIICVLPDFSIHKNKNDYTVSKYFIKKVGYLRAISRADAIISYSQSVANDLNIFYPQFDNNRVFPIWLGVSPQFLVDGNVSSAKLTTVRNKYNLHFNYFLFVGTLMPRKNLTGLIKAFETNHRDITKDLVVVGVKGWKYKELLKYFEKSKIKDRIHFLGYVEDDELPAIYRMSAFLVLPSFDEGFGIPIVEAFSLGVPVVTSNLSSMKEIASGAALLVDPNDTAQLSDTLLQFSSDNELLHKYSILSKKAGSKFSWSQNAEKYLEVVRKVVSVNPK